jgi:hypothetical protein
MTQDSKSGSGWSNSGRGRSMSADFNEGHDVAQQIAQLSPEARQKAQLVQELGDESLDSERKSQQRAHNFRVMKAKVELLENYILNPIQRHPDGKTQDIEIINQEAERIVSAREEYHLDQITKGTEAKIRHLIAKDRQPSEGSLGDRAPELE